MRIQKKLINSILSKVSVNTIDKPAVSYLITFDELYALLGDLDERAYIELLLNQKQSDFGNTEPFLGIEPVPDDVVALEGQVVAFDGKEVVIPTQYMPRNIYDAYLKLKKAYKASSGKSMLIGSGYRSPANQAINFLYWLKYYNYDFAKTLSYVAIPGYSQHSLAKHTAVDFRTEEGIWVFDAPPFGRFDETPEYAWLLQNAGKYGFVLAFPEGNTFGAAFEPWHWQYQG